jgi:hypothetical protein
MKKILMASVVIAVFAISILLLQLTSCKKAVGQTTPDCPTPIYPVEGLYVGTYSVNSLPGQGNLYYTFVVFPNGDLLTKNVVANGDTVYQKGSWTMSNDSFNATIATFSTPSVIQNIKGKFSDDGKISDATWKDIYNPYGSGLSGNFSVMQRVN